MAADINTTLATGPIIWFVLQWAFIGLIIAGWFYGFYLIAMSYTKRRKRMWLERQRYTTLVATVPRANEKGPQSAMYFFAAMHGIYKSAKELLEEGSFQEHMSFEIVSQPKYLRFYIQTPTHLKDFLIGQLYAQYPLIEIKEVEDYALESRDPQVGFVGTELVLTNKDYYPIKTFQNFEVVDPLAGITSVLSQVEDDEQIWTQFLVRPTGEEWQKEAISFINGTRSGGMGAGSFGVKGILLAILKGIGIIAREIISPPKDTKPAAPVKLSGPAEQAMKAIETKSTQLGFEVKTRIMFFSSKPPEAMKLKMQSIVGAFKQYNASNLNGFTSRGLYLNDFEFLNKYQTRQFEERGYVLNIEELASLYHLPTAVIETPNIVWAGSKKGEPPADLPVQGVTDPLELTVFARTNFRGESVNFGIKREDRLRHMYIIGKTGTGKSTMMENMVIDDMREGRGCCVIDPHGSFIDNLMPFIPEHRVNDVVIINPSDREYSVGFNLLTNRTAEERELIASGIMGVFLKVFEGWSDRMQYIAKNTLLALMETPGTTFLSIPKMWINKDYRKMIVDNVSDPQVKDFWLEFEQTSKTNPKYVQEATAALHNKIGQFLAAPSVRAIVGQAQSTIDFKDIMDSSKIVFIRLSKGEIGEDNVKILGSMFITKIKLTAMERSGIDEKLLSPFFLYVDEFQNFATNSFAEILSEARKYKLGLIVAHQYVKQLTPEIWDAVSGNVGSAVIFGCNDSDEVLKFVEPVFTKEDIKNLANWHIYVDLLVDGKKYPAFSAITIPREERFAAADPQDVIAASRRQFAVPRERVEEAIRTWTGEVAELSAKIVVPGTLTMVDELGNAGPTYSVREIKDKKNNIWYARKKTGTGEGAAPQASFDPKAASLHTDFTESADVHTPQATMENELTSQFETDFTPLFEVKKGSVKTDIRPGQKVDL